MSAIYHKFFLLLLILSPLLRQTAEPLFILAMLLSVSLSFLCNYQEKNSMPVFYLLFCAALFFWKPMLPFLPLAVYDSPRQKEHILRFLWLLPFFRCTAVLEFSSFFFCIVLCGLAFFLSVSQAQHEILLQNYRQTQDDSREAALLLQQKNLELMKNQDYEVELATLKERNRIAREIHDNVGHLLTRSILQVSALLVVHRNNPELTESLQAVKATLTDAMDNVRNSVHNLHQESVDLKQQIEKIIENFSFCPVSLTFDTHPLPGEMNYAVMAIIKEALSNIARHSNATHAWISILEHPSMYQLLIRDNGSVSPSFSSAKGIGLSGMEERVLAFHGIFHTDFQNGFHIFISIPKQKQS